MESDVRQLQLCELAILKEVAELCDKFGLKYYLAEGTLLGAIRHKGFIPWDDDIDIAMPREDYNRFVELSKSELPENLYCENFNDVNDEEKDFLNHVTICSRNWKIKWHFTGPEKISPVFIDILPLDGIPSHKGEQLVHRMRIFFWNKLMRCSQVNSINRNRSLVWWKKFGIKLAEVFKMDKLNSKQLCARFEKAAQRYPYKKAEMVIDWVSEYKLKTVCPRKYYGDGRYTLFENLYLRVPQEAEKLLMQEYGDYMTLPPLEERKPKHSILLIE